MSSFPPDPASPLRPSPAPASVWIFIRTCVPRRLWSEEPICVACAYSLVGLPEYGICPECGQPFTPESAHLSTSRSRRQLRRVTISYAIIVLAVPLLHTFVSRSVFFRNVIDLQLIILVVLAPFASARLIGALTALAIESRNSRSEWRGWLLLLVIVSAHLALMFLTAALMAFIALGASRLL